MVARPETSGKSIAALVLGIVSVVLYPVAVITGPLAIGFGVSATKAARREPQRVGGRGLAIAGIVCGSVGLAIALLVVGLFLFVFLTVDGFEVDGGPPEFVAHTDGEGGVLEVVAIDGSDWWSGYVLAGTADCDLPFGEIEVGDEIVCFTDGTVRVRDAYSGETVYQAEV